MRYFFGRKGILLSLVILLTAVLFSGIFHTPVKKQITREDYEKVKIGMTFEEVRAVFGRDPDGTGSWPGGFQTLKSESLVWTDHVTRCGASGFPCPGWSDFVCNGLIFDGNTIGVGFDTNGRVNSIHFSSSDVPPSIIERIRDRIRARVP